MAREHHPSPRGRILLVEDDPDTARFIRRVLTTRGGYDVERAVSPPQALPRIGAERWDLVITDVEMPDMTGIELLEALRREAPATPVAVITAHLTVDNAVGSLRGRADEFMQKPLHPDTLIAAARRLIERGRAGRESVLAVGAHPGDVEIGSAGALLAHRAVGHDVAILAMSRGARGGSDDGRAAVAREAAAILDAELYLEDLEDNRISESDPTISAIRAVVEAVQPTIVYTHSIHDVHQDHRNAHRAVIVATRGIGSVLCYQSPSATVDFRPARFITIDDHIATKLAAIGAFAAQASVREYLEPDLIEATARYWSRFGGGRHAEAFEVVRDHSAGPATGWTAEDAAQEAAAQEAAAQGAAAQEATAEAALLNTVVRENAADERAARQILEAGHAIT